jgi:hypothetical protein
MLNAKTRVAVDALAQLSPDRNEGGPQYFVSFDQGLEGRFEGSLV